MYQWMLIVFSYKLFNWIDNLKMWFMIHTFFSHAYSPDQSPLFSFSSVFTFKIQTCSCLLADKETEKRRKRYWIFLWCRLFFYYYYCLLLYWTVLWPQRCTHFLVCGTNKRTFLILILCCSSFFVCSVVHLQHLVEPAIFGNNIVSPVKFFGLSGTKWDLVI